MFLSEWREFTSQPCLAGKKNYLMTARAWMLLKSRASLTCFRGCFLPGRAKDLSAYRYRRLCGPEGRSGKGNVIKFRFSTLRKNLLNLYASLYVTMRFHISRLLCVVHISQLCTEAFYLFKQRIRDSTVGAGTGMLHRQLTNHHSIPSTDKGVVYFQSFQTDHGAHAASYSVGNSYDVKSKTLLSRVEVEIHLSFSLYLNGVAFN